MAKAIYAKIGDDYYQVDQSTTIPTKIARITKTTARMDYNESEREMRATVNISALETDGVKSNRSMYEDMIDFLSHQPVTFIKKISNQFMIYVDYTIFNNDGKEVTHSCVTKPMGEGTDAILPLGVAYNNECVYRRCKVFDPQIVFSVTNNVPLGVMGYNYGRKYTLKLNDICILQSVDRFTGENFNSHNSIYGNSYDYNSHTINSLLKNNIPIYSSHEAGIDIGEFTVSFYPRKVIIALHAIVPNSIVVYDDNVLKDIIANNLEDKYQDLSPDINVDSDSWSSNRDRKPIFPETETKPAATGKKYPDKTGMYHYYERCLSTNPGALLVVEDTLMYPSYNKDTMIHQSDVLADIPDITCGEYVRYQTGFDINALN